MTKNLNLGILAHVDAGKTTITEQLLYKTSIIKEIGRVDKGNTVTDSMSLEKKRGITIKTTTVSFEYSNIRINLLDTPGHMDFIAEVERSLAVLDGVILVLSAREGVQPQTRVIFSALQKLNIPTILFVNKVDRMGVDLDTVLSDISKYLTPNISLMQTVKDVGTRSIKIDPFESDPNLVEENFERLALISDAFMISYLNADIRHFHLLHDLFMTEFETAFQKTEIYPVLYGAALHGHGIDELLNAIISWFEGYTADALFARVYKIDRDQLGNRRCWLRIFSGFIELRKTYSWTRRECEFKVRTLSIVRGSGLMQTEFANAGDIAVIHSEDLCIDDIIGSEDLSRPGLRLQEPTMKAVVPTPDLGIRKKVLSALDILTDEDPFLNYSIHPITDAVEVHLFGIVQKEILEGLLKERFDLEISIEEPGTVFMETPTEESSACLYMYKDHFLPATVGVRLEPLKSGSGVQYSTEVSFGDLKKTFQNAVEEGARSGLSSGPKGWRVTDCKITFILSEFNSVDSTPADFRKTAKKVVEMALENAETQLIEPILSFEISVPDYAIGKVISDVMRMEGHAEAPTLQDGTAIIQGLLPARTSRNFNAELADYTSGKGIITTQFHSWRPYIPSPC
jgi:ribosomal protection tetracycline resistance protein